MEAEGIIQMEGILRACLRLRTSVEYVLGDRIYGDSFNDISLIAAVTHFHAFMEYSSHGNSYIKLIPPMLFVSIRLRSFAFSLGCCSLHYRLYSTIIDLTAIYTK